MPPKNKFERDEIIGIALDFVRKNGMKALTARKLGEELGTSSRPIFTAFQNMEEVQQEIEKAARDVYNRYIDRGLAEEPSFKGVGMYYFRFAKEEPKLFELLFMNENKVTSSLADILPAIDDNSDKILSSIQVPYGLTKEKSLKLYQSLWIFTHGIACLCATNVVSMTEEEVSELLTEIFIGQLIKIKSEEK